MDRLFTLPVYKGYSSVSLKINMENHKEKFDEYCKVIFIDGENKVAKLRPNIPPNSGQTGKHTHK